MKAIISFGLSILLILMGLGLLAWIAYNVFVEMQPAAEGRNPIGPTLFGLGLVAAGVFRVGARRRANRDGRDDLA